MFNRFPFYEDNYASPYDLSFRRLRRERELEARRQAELERRQYQMQLEKEQLAKQRRLRELQRQAELQQREEEERRREIYLQKKRQEEEIRRKEASASRAQKLRRSKRDRFPIVRGADGQLYRVVPNEYDPYDYSDVLNAPESPETDEMEVETCVHPKKTRLQPTSVPIETKATSSVTIGDEEMTVATPKKSSRPRRKRVTIVVEDASDSEYEDDEFASVWRNRRPSPGKWIEPVEGYE